jgi:NAD-dependent SIR2 family protein deacetylase
MDEGKVDLIMVIGTTAQVYPAAGYVGQARDRGARVAVVNMDAGDTGSAGTLQTGDFLFEGDAAKILPEILRGVIGDLGLA